MSDKTKKTIWLVFVIVWGILFVFALGFMGWAYHDGHWRFHYDISVERVSICTGQEVEPPDRAQEKDRITAGEKIFICGYLYTGTDIAVPISFLIRRTEEQGVSLVGKNRPGDRLNEGYFFKEIPQGVYQQEGLYRVEIYDHRILLATFMFEVAGEHR